MERDSRRVPCFIRSCRDEAIVGSDFTEAFRMVSPWNLPTMLASCERHLRLQSVAMRVGYWSRKDGRLGRSKPLPLP